MEQTVSEHFTPIYLVKYPIKERLKNKEKTKRKQPEVQVFFIDILHLFLCIYVKCRGGVYGSTVSNVQCDEKKREKRIGF